MAYPQSAFAAEPFGPQPFPWAGCLHGASAIRICSRAIRAPTSPTSPLCGLPAWCIRNLQLQTSHLDPTSPLGGLPAGCIRNLQLQTSHSDPTSALGGLSAGCIRNPQLQPSIFVCNCSRTSAIASEQITHTHTPDTHTHTHCTVCVYWSPQEEAPAAPAFINL